jgi:transposase
MFFAGVDWGDKTHSICVIDEQGAEAEAFDVRHDAAGLDELAGRLKKHEPLAGVAIETSKGPLVSMLASSGIIVYPVNPKVAKAWREGWSANGAKTDPGDARTLAHGLRQHHQNLRPLLLDSPLARELAILCADEKSLIQQRTAVVNVLIAALKAYYPEALGWFDDWTSPTAHDFIISFPTPAALRAASKKRLFGFLKTHNIGLSEAWKKRIDAARGSGPAWPADAPVRAAKSLLAVSTARQLRTIDAVLREYRKRIADLFENHPDSGIFSSLPGAGAKLAPRLLSSFGDNRAKFQSAHSAQELSGVVPYKFKSGKIDFDKFRFACDKNFRDTITSFAYQSTRFCPWATAFYVKAKDRGQSHFLALRNLAAKWIKIIFRMWTDNVTYNDAVITRSLYMHGIIVPPRKGCEKP